MNTRLGTNYQGTGLSSTWFWDIATVGSGKSSVDSFYYYIFSWDDVIIFRTLIRCGCTVQHAFLQLCGMSENFTAISIM